MSALLPVMFASQERMLHNLLIPLIFQYDVHLVLFVHSI